MTIERGSFEARWLVAHAKGLEPDRREDFPVRDGLDPLPEPLRVREVTSNPRLEALNPLLPDEKPQLQRAKAAAEGDSPIPQILHLLVDRAAQIARVRAHHTNQMVRVAHVVHRSVESDSKPFVGIDDDRIDALD